MDKFEKVQKIKEKTGVSYTEAVEALDRCNGDILDAIVYLERSGRTSERNTATFTSSVNKNDKESDNLAHATAEYDRNSEKDGIDTFVDGVKVLLRKSIDTSFVVERFNKKIVDVPVLVLIICFIFTFWIILPLLVVGLFFDCRYRFVGVGKVTVDVNKFCDRAADGATNMKNSGRNERHRAEERREERRDRRDERREERRDRRDERREERRDRRDERRNGSYRDAYNAAEDIKEENTSKENSSNDVKNTDSKNDGNDVNVDNIRSFHEEEIRELKIRYDDSDED